MPFFTTDDDVRLYYSQHGEGEPVIMIHGLSANSLFFSKNIPVLAERFQVITPDLCGHGQSEGRHDHLTLSRLASDLKQLLEHLNLPKVSMIGWSMGAHVIFEYVKNYTCQAIEKLVVIDMAPRLIKATDWPHGLPGIFSRKPGDFGHEDNLYLLSVMLNDWQAYSQIVARRILNKSLFNEKMEFDETAEFQGKTDLPWLCEQTAKNRACVIAAYWVSMSMQDYRPVLKDLTVPCLLTYGTESNYYPAANYAWMQAQMPDARMLAFDGCGHALHLQDPDKFNRAVIEFYTQTTLTS